MKKRYEENHFKAFSNSVNKKKLYKKGKNWVIGSLTLLALTGLSVTVGTAHADVTPTNQPSQPQSQVTDVQQKAQAVYTNLIGKAAADQEPQFKKDAQPTAVSSSTSSAASGAANPSASRSATGSSKPTVQQKRPLMLLASPDSQSNYKYNLNFYANGQLLNPGNTEVDIQQPYKVDGQTRYQPLATHFDYDPLLGSMKTNANLISDSGKPLIARINGKFYRGTPQEFEYLPSKSNGINNYTIDLNAIHNIQVEFYDLDTNQVVKPTTPNHSDYDIGSFLDSSSDSDVSIGNNNVITISNELGLDNFNFDELLTPYVPDGYIVSRYRHYNNKAYELWPLVSNKSDVNYTRSGKNDAIISFDNGDTTPLLKIGISSPEFDMVYHNGSQVVKTDKLNYSQLKSLYNKVSDYYDHGNQFVVTAGQNKYVIPSSDTSAGTPNNAHDLSDVQADLNSDLNGNKHGVITEHIPVNALTTIYAQYAIQNPDGSWKVLTPKNVNISSSMAIHNSGNSQIGLDENGVPKGAYVSDIGAVNSPHDLSNDNMALNTTFSPMVPDGFVLDKTSFSSLHYDLTDSLINQKTGYPVPPIVKDPEAESYLRFGDRPEYLIIGIHRPQITIHYVDNLNDQDIDSKTIQQQPGTNFDVSPDLAAIPSGYSFVRMKGNILTFPNQDHDIFIYISKPQPTPKPAPKPKPKPAPKPKTRGHISVRYVDESNDNKEFWSDKYSDVDGTTFNLSDDNYKNRYIPGYHFDKVLNNTNTFGNQSSQAPYVITVDYTNKSGSQPPRPVVGNGRGHISVQYVDESNDNKEFWSDKYSDAEGATFNLSDDNYKNRYIPGYHFDKVSNNTNTFGKQPSVITVGYAADPAKPPKVITKTVTVPGPTKYVNVPGPTKYITKNVPGPTKYVTKTVPGPTQYITKYVPVDHVKTVVKYINNGPDQQQVPSSTSAVNYMPYTPQTSLPTNTSSQVPSNKYTRPVIHHTKAAGTRPNVVNSFSDVQEMPVGATVHYHGMTIRRLSRNRQNLFYFYVVKNCFIHIKMKYNHQNRVRPLVIKRGTTMPIERIFKANGKIRFEVLLKNNQYGFVTGNKRFTRNAYYQLRDFHSDLHVVHMIKIIREACEYRNANYTRRNFVRALHVGKKLRVKKLITIASKHMTRFQLTNGNWVTSNKNFVKLIK